MNTITQTYGLYVRISVREMISPQSPRIRAPVPRPPRAKIDNSGRFNTARRFQVFFFFQVDNISINTVGCISRLARSDMLEKTTKLKRILLFVVLYIQRRSEKTTKIKRILLFVME